MDLYEIQFKYLDALNEPWHTANVVAYDSEGDGKELSEALSNEDFDKADKILLDAFDLRDDDICFYYDWVFANAEDGRNACTLVLELQKSHDILVNDITYVTGA